MACSQQAASLSRVMDLGNFGVRKTRVVFRRWCEEGYLRRNIRAEERWAVEGMCEIECQETADFNFENQHEGILVTKVIRLRSRYLNIFLVWGLFSFVIQCFF